MGERIGRQEQERTEEHPVSNWGEGDYHGEIGMIGVAYKATGNLLFC